MPDKRAAKLVVSAFAMGDNLRVPGQHDVLVAAAWIHRRIGYQGGRLALEAVFDALPGVLLCPMTKRTLLGRAGVTSRNGDSVRIGFDTSLSRPEKRRVVAHEVGHALLHVGLSCAPRVRGVRCRTEEIGERQADLFAEELLAPRWALRDELTNCERSRRELATLFDVPEMLIREA